MATYVVGISGASGAVYGTRLIAALALQGHALHVVISDTARSIVRDETGLDLGQGPEAASRALSAHAPGAAELQVHDPRNLYATIASGSVPTDGMVVAPCSMKTLASIAHGLSDTLLGRAADVHMKEGRPLILVPRETPLSLIHLDNMRTLAAVPGVRILPAMPAFYTRPQSVNDLVDFVVARILDNLGAGGDITPRWQGVSAPSRQRPRTGKNK
ncbi:MAG: UbiX family flavin prenyltransferase [Nitrospirota bacterium]|nr:UbiX family flavin prenyltransferase [Nitrospirota bacterium]